MNATFQPTHFIEQYNYKPEYKPLFVDNPSENYVLSQCLLIHNLKQCLEDTKQMTYRHTVAIFKIALKDKSTHLEKIKTKSLKSIQ